MLGVLGRRHRQKYDTSRVCRHRNVSQPTSVWFSVAGVTTVEATTHADLPRVQIGANPQHLIVTVLGDYWRGRKEHVPSAGLVALANEFGITSTSARAALSRLARRGLLESSKHGRATFYGLTSRAEHVLSSGFERIVTFGLDDGPWDGSWVVVIFSVPEDQRDVRHVLRTRLRWLGFAPLYDGAWVSPRADPADAATLLQELGIASGTVLVSRVVHPLTVAIRWRRGTSTSCAASYDDFIARFAPLLDRARRGQGRRRRGARGEDAGHGRVAPVPEPRPRAARGRPADGLATQRGAADLRQRLRRPRSAGGARVQQILAAYAPSWPARRVT